MDTIKNFFKNNWEHFAAIFGFIIIALVYYSPVLEGLSIKMHDIQGFNGMSKEVEDMALYFGEKSGWSNNMFSGMPTYFYHYPILNPVYDILNFFHTIFKYPASVMIFAMVSFYFLARSFKVVFWIAILGAIAYAFSTYNIIITQAGHITKFVAISLFPLVLLGLHLIYDKFETKKYLGLALLALFAAMEIAAGHVQMTFYLAFALGGYGVYQLINHYKEKNIKGFLIKTSFVVFAALIAGGLNSTRNALSVNYSKYSMRGGTILEVENKEDNRSEQQRAYDKINKTSGLDRDYITHWSYGIGETYNLLVPNAKGYPSLTSEYFDKLVKKDRSTAKAVAQAYQKERGAFGAYWGDQPGTVGPNYLGALIVFLALLYILLVHNPLKWALLAPMILTIMLSWGKNLGGGIEGMWLTNFFIDYVPLYNKFRTVSSILVVTNLIAPIMAVLFVNKLVTDKEWTETNKKKLMITGGAIVGVILLIGLAPTALFDLINIKESALLERYYAQKGQIGFNPEKLEEAVVALRSEIFWDSTLRSLLYILGGFGALLLMINGKLKAKVVLPILVVLTFVDLWSEGRIYMNNDKKKGKYTYWEKKKSFANVPLATAGDQEIFKRESAANPKVNEELNRLTKLYKDKKGSSRLDKYEKEKIQYGALNLSTNYRVMDVDNPFNSSRASYFHKSTGGYSPAKLRRYQDIIDYYISKELRYLNTKELEKMKVLNMLNNKYYLYNGQLAAVNPYVYGNAWFVKKIKTVNSPNAEIEAIADINPKETVILHEEEEKKLTGASTNFSGSGNIKMTSYKPNEITYSASVNGNQLAVFSEIYYPEDWKIYIDDKEVEMLRANYFIRALEIPSGNHQIKFVFKSEKEPLLSSIVIASFVLLLGVFGFAFWKRK
jgi:hypothetical protein